MKLLNFISTASKEQLPFYDGYRSTLSVPRYFAALSALNIHSLCFDNGTELLLHQLYENIGSAPDKKGLRGYWRDY